jgi:hypothetical protein
MPETTSTSTNTVTNTSANIAAPRSEGLTPLNVNPAEFLGTFFAADEIVCLRVFDDRKATAFRGAKLECRAGQLSSIMDALKRHNAQNRGVYFVVNHGGHEDADITSINAQFVECDLLSLDEQYAQVMASSTAFLDRDLARDMNGLGGWLNLPCSRIEANMALRSPSERFSANPIFMLNSPLLPIRTGETPNADCSRLVGREYGPPPMEPASADETKGSAVSLPLSNARSITSSVRSAK